MRLTQRSSAMSSRLALPGRGSTRHTPELQLDDEHVADKVLATSEASNNVLRWIPAWRDQGCALEASTASRQAPATSGRAHRRSRCRPKWLSALARRTEREFHHVVETLDIPANGAMPAAANAASGTATARTHSQRRSALMRTLQATTSPGIVTSGWISAAQGSSAPECSLSSITAGQQHQRLGQRAAGEEVLGVVEGLHASVSVRQHRHT